MKRRIISIDEKKCTGCGQCIPDCPEGALQVIDGKARLVSDIFCDGLGACIGTCPEGAISTVERDAEPYDEKSVMATITEQGAPVIRAHLEHLAGHGQRELYNQAIEYLIENSIPIPDHTPPERLKSSDSDTPGMAKGRNICGPESREGHPFAACPGSAAMRIHRPGPASGGRGHPAAGSRESALRQWPIQLSLLNPSAAYFDNADLLVAADCAPFAFPDFHDMLLSGKILIIFCPKLDRDIDGYIEKLAEIFRRHTIQSITVARMEVPCCGGVRYVVDKALGKAGKSIPVTERTIAITGSIVP